MEDRPRDAEDLLSEDEEEGKENDADNSEIYTEVIGNWREFQHFLEDDCEIGTAAALFENRSSTDGNKEMSLLKDAVEICDETAVRRILEGQKWVDPQNVIEGYHDAVVCAVKTGNKDVLRALIETHLFSAYNSENSSLRSMIAAAQNGNFEFIEAAINTKKMKKVVSRCGINLASLFVVRDCPASCLRALALQGVCLSNYDCNGYIPLMWAVLWENVECVSYLARRSIKDVDICPIGDNWGYFSGMVTGRTSLMHAVYLSSTACLKIMVDMLTQWGEPKAKALVFAVHIGNEKAISFLMESGAKIDNFPGLETKMLIGYIKSLTNANYLDKVLSSVSNDLILKCLLDSKLDTAVFDSDVLGILLNHLQYAPIFDAQENTLLKLAARNGQVDYVKQLLDKRRLGKTCKSLYSDTKCLSFDDDTHGALLNAIERCHDSIAEILIIHSWVDINKRNQHERTALMYACHAGRTNIASLLVNGGADVSAQDAEGKTALMLACSRGDSEIVELLMRSGSKIDAQCIFGMTPLMYLCAHGHSHILELLLKYLRPGIFVDQREECGQTALMIACQRQHADIVNTLVTKYKAYVNARDIVGRTALMYACSCPPLANRVHYRVLNNRLEWCCPRIDNNLCKIIETLLSAQADTDCTVVGTHNNEETAFTLALVKNNHVIKTLLESGKFTRNGRLKDVHKHCIRQTAIRIGAKFMAFLVENNVFEWDLCPLDCFPQIAGSVVDRGLCPGKIEYRSSTRLYPLSMAVVLRNVDLMRLFIDRLYFLPEDYQYLCSEEYKREWEHLISPDRSTRTAVRLEEMLHDFIGQPLSLKTWSFLAASRAITLAGLPFQRPGRVDTLPIPVRLKRMMKFQADECYERPCFKRFTWDPWRTVTFNT